MWQAFNHWFRPPVPPVPAESESEIAKASRTWRQATDASMLLKALALEDAGRTPTFTPAHWAEFVLAGTAYLRPYAQPIELPLCDMFDGWVRGQVDPGALYGRLNEYANAHDKAAVASTLNFSLTHTRDAGDAAQFAWRIVDTVAYIRSGPAFDLLVANSTPEEIAGWHLDEWGGAAPLPERGQYYREAQAHFVSLLRDILEDPFLPPALETKWLTWNDGAAARIAREIQSSQDFTALPVLGDALEEAGCTDAEILGHCRSGLHLPCCWLLKKILASSPEY